MALKRKDLLYPELSYEILGAAFDVYNELGWGHPERIYQNAFAEALKKRGLSFEREKFVAVKYKDAKVGRAFLDFVIDDKVVVELKVAPHMGYVHINQVVQYLKETHHQLGIMIYFLRNGVRYRRILNTC